MTNEKFNQENNQQSVQTNQKNNQSNQQVGAKTVVNGKVVPLAQAQQMTEAFEMQNTSTGIQQHHDNSSESVKAGEVGQMVQSQNQDGVASFMKQANVQSGQSHLEQMGQNSAELQGTKAQQMKQEENQVMQDSLDAKAKAKAKKDN